MPKESKQRSRFLFRVQLSDDLDEQLDEALEILRLRTILKPVEATLSNPTAFPLLFGVIGVGVGFFILRSVFPDPLGQARSAVEEVAEKIAEIINTPLPNVPGVADLEQVRQNLINGTRDLLMKLWDGIAKLPPILSAQEERAREQERRG